MLHPGSPRPAELRETGVHATPREASCRSCSRTPASTVSNLCTDSSRPPGPQTTGRGFTEGEFRPEGDVLSGCSFSCVSLPISGPPALALVRATSLALLQLCPRAGHGARRYVRRRRHSSHQFLARLPAGWLSKAPLPSMCRLRTPTFPSQLGAHTILNSSLKTPIPHPATAHKGHMTQKL